MSDPSGIGDDAAPNPDSGSGFGPDPGYDPDGAIRWDDLLDETVQRLAAVFDQPTARREARWIVDEFADVDSRGVEGRQMFVTIRALTAFDEVVARRVTGEPLQYVIGHWPFRSLDLIVDRRVLIPRPETEWIAEVALGELRRLAGPASGVSSDVTRPTVVDLGTGSGALGLSIAAESDAAVWLTDRSPDALAVARANLAGLGPAATRVRIAEGSWFDALPDELRGAVDLVVTNPPYVATADVVDDVVARWEPAEALYSGTDGLDDLRHLIEGAPHWLAPHGVFVSEIGSAQGPAALSLAQHAGLDADVVDDLAGHPRALIARR